MPSDIFAAMRRPLPSSMSASCLTDVTSTTSKKKGGLQSADTLPASRPTGRLVSTGDGEGNNKDRYSPYRNDSYRTSPHQLGQ